MASGFAEVELSRRRKRIRWAKKRSRCASWLNKRKISADSRKGPSRLEDSLRLFYLACASFQLADEGIEEIVGPIQDDPALCYAER